MDDPPQADDLDFDQRLKAFAATMSAIGSHTPRAAAEPGRVEAEPLAPLPVHVPVPAATLPEITSPIALPLATLASRLTASLVKAGRRTQHHADDEAIHDLRVSSRRLVVMLQLWREVFREGSRRRAVRRLRALRRRLGEARELEVLVTRLSEHLRGSEGEAQRLAEFLHDARHRLAAARRRAANRIRPRRLDELVAALERTAGRIGSKALQPPSPIEPARERVVRLTQDAVGALGTALENPDDELLHRARIAVKKWRYASEAWTSVTSEPPSPSLDSMRELQEILGIIQDCASLGSVLVPIGPLGVTDEFRPLVERLERERIEALDRFQSVAPAVLRRVNLAIIG